LRPQQRHMCMCMSMYDICVRCVRALIHVQLRQKLAKSESLEEVQQTIADSVPIFDKVIPNGGSSVLTPLSDEVEQRLMKDAADGPGVQGMMGNSARSMDAMTMEMGAGKLRTVTNQIDKMPLDALEHLESKVPWSSNMLAPFGVAEAIDVVDPLTVPDVDLEVALRVSCDPDSDCSLASFWPKHDLTRVLLR
jgi:hypothetical protein